MLKREAVIEAGGAFGSGAGELREEIAVEQVAHAEREAVAGFFAAFPVVAAIGAEQRVAGVGEVGVVCVFIIRHVVTEVGVGEAGVDSGPAAFGLGKTGGE